MADGVVLITGGASGIGAAAGAAFAARGYAVELADRDAAGLERVVASLEAAGASVQGTVVDVTRPAEVEAVVHAAVQRHGGLDVVCPNAGIVFPEKPLEEITDDELDALLSVNVKGVVHVLRASLPSIRGGGAIVLTSSISGLLAHPGDAVYAASKVAIIGLGRSLALEVASRGIRVNMVCPGGVDTPLTRGAYGEDAEQVIDGYRAANPLGRIAAPEDIANAMVFLASPEARHVNGVALRVDGGDCLLGAL